MGNSISLIIIIFCILMSAFFSASEMAFSTLNRIRIKNMAEKGNKKAALVLKLSANYDGLLSTILIGNNIVNIFSASLATIIFVRMLGDEAGASVSTAVTTIVVLIFGEISPKSIAKESPERLAMFFAPFLQFFIFLLTPLNFIFKQWKKLLSMIFKVSEEKGITEEELMTIVEEAEQGGGIGKEESTLIRSAIAFNELEAVDIFTPRIDVVGISVETPKEKIAKIFGETGYSRLPVYEEDMEQIIGILYQKDFHNFIYYTDEKISDFIKPVIFIMKNKKIDDLMKELQQKKLHLAVIVDEFGSMIGIVTLEDILEELVGEIWDEHDKVTEEVVEVSETEYIVSGKANIEKLFEVLDIDRDIEVHTVNGWIMEMLGRVPIEGDFCQDKQLEAKVLKMNGKRVEKVLLKLCVDED